VQNVGEPHPRVLDVDEDLMVVQRRFGNFSDLDRVRTGQGRDHRCMHEATPSAALVLSCSQKENAETG
jgi:hypothetical protein